MLGDQRRAESGTRLAKTSCQELAKHARAPLNTSEVMGVLAAGRHVRPVTARTFTLDTIHEADTYVAS